MDCSDAKYQLPHRRGRSLALILALVACTIASALASARPAHSSAYTDGPSFNLGAGATMPAGVAIDQTADKVYVGRVASDDIMGPGGVFAYGLDGAPLGQVPNTSNFYSGVAVDPVDGDIYGFTAGFMAFPATLDIFEPDGTVGPSIPASSANAFGAQHIDTDSAGNVYYPNDVDNSVQKFAPTGGPPLLTITGTGDNALNAPSSVAVDGEGGIYIVDDAAGGRVQKFDSTGTFIDVVDSGGSSTVANNPMNDNIVVGRGADAAFTLREFDSTGVQVAEDFATGDFAAGQFSREAIDVDEGTGTIYAIDGGFDDSHGRMRTYVPIPPPTVETDEASSIGSTTTTLNGTVNPNGTEVTSCSFDYVTEADYQESDFTLAEVVPCTPDPGGGSSPESVSAEIADLLAGTAYHFRLRAINAGGESLTVDGSADGPDTFETGINPLPIVETEPATSAARTTATLNGSVDPEGSDVTDCAFEYVTETQFQSNGFVGANSIDCGALPGSGIAPVDVSATATGLTPGTAYRVRLRATNAGGTSIDLAPPGGELFFTSLDLPEAITTPTAAIGQRTATFKGTVDPHGLATTCVFEYGVSNAFDQTAPCAVNPGAGDDPVPVSASVSDLTPGAVYQVRLKATNVDGSDTGSTVTFTTERLDTDNDGVPDSEDQCDTVPGPGSNAGCPTPPPPPAGKWGFAAKSAVYKAGRTSIKIKCGDGACQAGKVTLKAKVKKGKRKPKTAVVGKGTLKASIDGTVLTLKIKLSGPARAALSKTGRLRVTVSGDVTGTVTVKGGKKRKKRRT